MLKKRFLKAALFGSVCVAGAASAAAGAEFDIPAGSLNAALNAYSRQAGIPLIVSADVVRGATTKGVSGNFSPDAALSRILSGTGFTVYRDPAGALGIGREKQSAAEAAESLNMQLAQAMPAARPAVETVTVTSSKLGGADVQSIPIAITALSQEQLTSTQTAGGPDLVKQVPNLTFTKTNFSGYSIQIRGIGTQAISVTTDPAVAVALNDIPFIRNHFFEQEFYDLSQVEVLRGPQGTLYGRNATAGVVNLTTARPTDQFEAMASAEAGNYSERRFEGMVNLPIVDDRLDIRVAGEWTKRNGYSFNDYTDSHIDGRDLWSGRVTIGLKPVENLQMDLVWEHFSENDDRLRSGKQLCKNVPSPETINGITVPGGDNTVDIFSPKAYLSQGCGPVSLYSPDAFQVPNGITLPYMTAILNLGAFANGKNPYLDTVQSQNLRVIDSEIEPIYKAKNDTVELNTDYNLTPSLTFTSQTAYNQDFLYSLEDYNRFVSQPGIFTPGASGFGGATNIIDANGVFCDPQLGCSDRLMAVDLNDEHAWQLSQEFRLASHFEGPLNFSVGGNYLHYETEENYYVFINTLSIFADGSGLSPDGQYDCLVGYGGTVQTIDPHNPNGFNRYCPYKDPNPISSLNNRGHNYFLSQNPYVLNSYAAFGELYYDITKELKFTSGLRYTDDRKHFVLIPSELLLSGSGYAQSGVVDQGWNELTGRAAINWSPKLTFTDQTLIYGSYAHGYKAGGANPPGALFPTGALAQPDHPLTFKPEFIDAFELGSKNTLLDGALTLNASLFYYNYENYQISEIVDRTALNLNLDAHMKGAEVEATWEPLPGLRFNAGGGWQQARLAKGSEAVDLMDRTAGHAGWYVVKPFPEVGASNCVLPAYVITQNFYSTGNGPNANGDCVEAYIYGNDPITGSVYDGAHGTYPGFDPISPNATNNGYGPAPNGGAGFDKDLSGNELPNSPPLTATLGAQYTVPVTSDWAATLRGDYYWQDYSWARVFNDNPYDRLRGYTNVNFTLILTNQAGWQVMGYLKNAFNTTAITGAFLNSDDTDLTTNVFLTDPRLIGIRITKNW